MYVTNLLNMLSVTILEWPGCCIVLQGAKKLCPQCNMITSPADLRRIYLWSSLEQIYAESTNDHHSSRSKQEWNMSGEGASIHIWIQNSFRSACVHTVPLISHWYSKTMQHYSGQCNTWPDCRCDRWSVATLSAYIYDLMTLIVI